jgi:hypothetical protein
MKEKIQLPLMLQIKKENKEYRDSQIEEKLSYYNNLVQRIKIKIF